MNAFKLCLIILAFAVFIAACNQTPSTPNAANTAANVNKPADNTPAQPSQPVDELAAAKELYAKNCMICHKDTGKGGKVTIEGKTLEPDDLTADKLKNKSDEQLFGYISDGVTDEGMPAFKEKLTVDQIKSVVKHVRALHGK